MDATVHDVGAGGPRRGADLIAAEGIARVDADADDVPGGDGGGVETFERLVDQARSAPAVRARSSSGA